MKKIIIVLALLAGGYFSLSKWSPQTLERVKFWKRSAPQIVAARGLPEPEPAPTPATNTQVLKQDDENQTPKEQRPGAIAVDKTAQVVVLLYHRVEPEAESAGSLNITPEVFEQQMQRLKDGGLSVISMADFLAWRREEKNIPPRSVLITIDDGYVSAYHTARPILKKFGYPWTYFIYTKYVASGGKSITWEQLRELRDEGVEIGCHTVSHQDLRHPRGKSPEAYEQWLRDEIIAPKALIEKNLGIRCAVFAYPLGNWNTEVVQIVRDAGYEAAFTAYGQRVTHGAIAERIGRYGWNARRPQDMEMAFQFVGPLSIAESSPTLPPSGTPAAVLLTQPQDGDTVTDSQPTLKVNLAQVAGIDPASVSIRLSGIGLIPHKLDRETHLLESRPPEPLAPGEYTVTISGRAAGKRVETQWRFTVANKVSAGQ